MKLMLYVKSGCHLCEDAIRELRRLQSRYPHELELVDIHDDADLMARYGERIPVLHVGGREYAAPLLRSTLERALQRADA
jgi:hypothetical protein